MNIGTGWHSYMGKILPRESLDLLYTLQEESIGGRLKVGQKVRLRVTTPESATKFIPAIVFDVEMSNSKGIVYSLALPINNGDFYVVSPGYSGHGGLVPEKESAEASGIYTEVECEDFLLKASGKKNPDFKDKGGLKVIK